MSDEGPAVAGPLSADELRAMVGTVWPDWEVVSAEQLDTETDAVYRLALAAETTRREVVLKACRSADPAAFRPEPYLLDAIGRETAIPVPAVYGVVDDNDDLEDRDAVDEQDELPTPFFVMEHRTGKTVSGPEALGTDTLERVARDAGRYLGQLHDLGSFARFGSLRLASDAGPDDPSGGISRPEYVVTVGDDAHDEWGNWFHELTDGLIEGMADRFRDLEPAIRAEIDGTEPLFEEQFEPVLTHTDYRYRNLLVDPATGDTTAVLDFSNEFTADAEYNLAGVEHHLCGWVDIGDDRRERVREHLLNGYRETNTLRDDGSLWELYNCYLLATWLRGLRWFDDWHTDAPADDREATAETLRTVTRKLVDSATQG